MEPRPSSTESRTRTSSSTRPDSGWTDDTDLTGSVVSIDAPGTTLSKASSHEDGMVGYLQPLATDSQTVADRIRRIATAVCALERNDEVSVQEVQSIEKQLSSLTAVLRDNGVSQPEPLQTHSDSVSSSHENAFLQRKTVVEDGIDGADESDIAEIHQNLTDAVVAMRLRQQEQRHLHQLTVTKIEAVAERCLFQEQQLQEMVNEMKHLRCENRTLGEENDKLRETVAELEFEASKREVAVSAMTSAVAGLEGWIEDADKTKVDQRVVDPPARDKRQRRAIVRGKGRFRGRYYIDDEHDNYSDGSPDARELQDGVKAWIRGFRDVEDACSSPDPDRPRGTSRRPINVDEDDWGDFESPSNVLA